MRLPLRGLKALLCQSPRHLCGHTSLPACSSPAKPFATAFAVDGAIQLTLTKARPGETWPGAFVGHASLDPAAEESTKKAMLLERFQMEHPGFDFSGAEVTGAVPDPRTFMRGLGQ